METVYKHSISILSISLLWLFCFSPAQALTQTEAAKILAGDGGTNGWFGYSVAIDGDTAVIGRPLDDNFTGSVYIYTRSGAIWTEQQKLTTSGQNDADQFGLSVAIDGDTVIIAAPYSSEGSSTYVFTRSGTIWTEQQKLTATTAIYGGESVAIDGDTVVIGFFLDNDNATSSGSALVFTRSGTTWTEQQKLMASDGEANDYFGYSVAIDGNTVLVGAYLEDHNVSNTGSAYIFIRNGTTWTEQQKLTASGGEANEFFGRSVAIDGETVVIGASHDDNTGSAYVFIRNGTTWTEQQKLTASDRYLEDNFGWSVAIEGNTVLVGAYLEDHNISNNYVSNSGSAYVFTRSGTAWTELVKFIASDGVRDDYFGISVAIDGDMMVVGARENSAYTFNFTADTDNDGFGDDEDNCPQITNADQADLDNDGTGDVCDDDIDGDTVLNPADNCPQIVNTDQGDIDTDGTGDVCDDDMDGDTVLNDTDNCPSIANTDQSDVDNNGIGDVCDGATNNDLDVFKPKHKSTVVSQNPTLYFRFDPAVEGYFVDLVGPNTDFNNCNGVIAYHGYVQRQGSDCLATAGNNVGSITGGDGNPAFPPNVASRVCEWTPPTQLNSGHYAASVTAFDQHTATLISNAGIQDVLSRDQHCDDSYQDFKVSATNTIPQSVTPLMPTFGFSCDINTSVPNDGQCRPVIKGTDAGESVDTSATWMQIYVNSAGGFNLTQAWYKVKVGGAVPTNKVHCTTAGGQTTCVFPDIANVLMGEQGPYTWWVRSWNAAGASAWSAAATMTE